MDQKQTIEGILGWFKESIEGKQPIGPRNWMQGALKLNVLKEDVDNDIAEFETRMAEKEAELIEQGNSAAKAEKLKIRAVDYKKYLQAVALEDRIKEFIRLAKKQAQLVAEHKDY